MANKLLSCIVCAYNAENTIARALGSLLNPNFSDLLEVIVINDGSKDSTSRIIDAFAGFDFVKTFTQENSGLGVARNVGLRESEGEFVTFCDADDVFFIENYIGLAQDAKIGKFDMACSKSYALVGGVELSDFWDSHVIDLILKSKKEAKNILKFLLQPSVCNKIFRRDFVESRDIRFGEDVLFEDVEFTTKSLIMTENILYSDRPVFLYDFQGQGTITSEKTLRRFEIFGNIEKILPCIEGGRLNSLQMVALSVGLMRTVLWCLDNVPPALAGSFIDNVVYLFSLLVPKNSFSEIRALSTCLNDHWDKRALYVVNILLSTEKSSNEIKNKLLNLRSIPSFNFS